MEGITGEGTMEDTRVDKGDPTIKEDKDEGGTMEADEETEETGLGTKDSHLDPLRL